MRVTLCPPGKRAGHALNAAGAPGPTACRLSSPSDSIEQLQQSSNIKKSKKVQFLFGKQPASKPDNSLTTPKNLSQLSGQPESRLFYVVDKVSKTRFLVDTGAEVSAVPVTRADRQGQPTYSLQAVNATRIATFGQRSLTMDFGLRRTFRWVFLVADVKHAIVGADFLRHFGLLVDMKYCCLRDATTHLSKHSRHHGMHGNDDINAASTRGTKFQPLLHRLVDGLSFHHVFCEHNMPGQAQRDASHYDNRTTSAHPSSPLAA